MDEYACYDGANYRKGLCVREKKINDFDIKDHPDISKYVLKSEVLDKMAQTVKKIQNQPIETHPEYSKLKNKFQQILNNKMDELRTQLETQPIEKHRDYKKLMDTYACSEGDCNNKYYVPCKSCNVFPKFKINEHPDFHLYIKKEDAKQAIGQIKQQLELQNKTTLENQKLETTDQLLNRPDQKTMNEYETNKFVKRISNRLKLNNSDNSNRLYDPEELLQINNVPKCQNEVQPNESNQLNQYQTV